MFIALALITNLVVTPKVCLAPCQYVRVVATVERKASNRWLVIQVDGDEMFRSSTVQVNGDDAPKTFRLELAHVPAGEYEVLAVLFDSTHEVERKRITFKITNGEELQPTKGRVKR